MKPQIVFIKMKITYAVHGKQLSGEVEVTPTAEFLNRKEWIKKIREAI